MSTNKARGELAERGVTLLRAAVSADILDGLRDAVAANAALGRPLSSQVLFTHGPPPVDRPPLTSIMNTYIGPFRHAGAGSTRAQVEAIRPLAAELLGEPPVLLQDVLLIKYPGQKVFPWHQDFGFWPVDKPLGVVLWVPLQATDPSSGAVRFAAGSHALGPRPVVDLHNGQPQADGAALGFDPDEWPAFTPSFEVGDVAAFTPLTFHSSPPMQRQGKRAAWSCVFLSPRVRWSHANAPNHPFCKHLPDGELIAEHMNA